MICANKYIVVFFLTFFNNKNLRNREKICTFAPKLITTKLNDGERKEKQSAAVGRLSV